MPPSGPACRAKAGTAAARRPSGSAAARRAARRPAPRPARGSGAARRSVAGTADGKACRASRFLLLATGVVAAVVVPAGVIAIRVDRLADLIKFLRRRLGLIEHVNN